MQSDIALIAARFAGIVLALALGLLIGVQRGWVQRDAGDGSRFAGIRTYGLLGLAGGLGGLEQTRAAGLAFVLLSAAAMLILLGYWRSTQGRQSISGTASLAGLITLGSGFLAGSGDYAVASAAAGLTLLVLALRGRLHRLVKQLNEREVLAIARFALIALVILPLLPDTPFGPYQAWRPRQLWLIVVLVSGFSFAGYAAVRLLGSSRGVLATAAAGSMVSSMAVTASLAGKLRSDTEDPAVLNAGIALASATMFLRVMVLTAVLAGFALPTLATIALPAMLVSLGGTVWLLRGRRASTAEGDDAAVTLRNPFALGPALGLMALTMVLIVVARWVLGRFGNSGLATALAISGTVDVDSAIITMGNLPAGLLTAQMAGLVLVPPMLLNTLFKAATLISLAGWRRGWPGAATLCASVAAGLASAAFQVWGLMI